MICYMKKTGNPDIDGLIRRYNIVEYIINALCRFNLNFIIDMLIKISSGLEEKIFVKADQKDIDLSEVFR